MSQSSLADCRTEDVTASDTAGTPTAEPQDLE
jgi:hypothetical protein